MKIHLVDYKEDLRTPVTYQYNPSDLDLEFEDLKYKSPLNMEGVIEKGQNTLAFEGRLSADIEKVCGRCLESTEDQIDKVFKLFYDIKNVLDLDATDDLRELILLDHPISYICREDCKPPGGEDGKRGKTWAFENDQPKPKEKGDSPFELLRKKVKEEKEDGTS